AVDGRAGDPYEHLLAPRETALTLGVIDGAPRYGQPRFMDRLTAGGDLHEHRTVGGAERVIDLTDAVADPLVGALSLAEAEARVAARLASLPELARKIETPLTAGAVLGASDGTNPGTWFLELDQDEQAGLFPPATADGLAARDRRPVPLWAMGAADPLSEVLGPLALDPLTVVDDDRYIDRLAGVPELTREGKGA